LFVIFNESYDKVIRSVNLTVMADYAFALDALVPLIDKLDFQRSPLRKTFYSRLERDILNGCLMPFLTIAINQNPQEKKFGIEDNREELMKLLKTAFVLDGIQRLNTLSRVADKPGFDPSRPIFFNILICESMDRLLYRMVTLNNGQRPMTARHQIEILAKNMLDFSNIPINTVTEKQTRRKSGEAGDDASIAKDTMVKSYMAFISNSVNIDNQKIIESKMDELITDKIMDSDITSREIQFSDVLAFIRKCLSNVYLKEWFMLPNNLIGFSAAMSRNFSSIMYTALDDLVVAISTFESAFKSIEVSTIKLGMARRRMVQYFFENFETLSSLDEYKLLDRISMEI